MKKYISHLPKLAKAYLLSPMQSFMQTTSLLPSRVEAKKYIESFTDLSDLSNAQEQTQAPNVNNPLRDYFEGNTEGNGIWKWNHYFDIYQRHLSKFVDRKIDLLEIGIYSGGSLAMWRSYFGEQCQVHGIDIEPACQSYENDHTKVYIGDQADRQFWRNVRKSAPALDVVIDDGGHSRDQQQITLEETLPYLKPGGVYICEDIHGDRNQFAAYASSLTEELNRSGKQTGQLTEFQKCIHSMHFYPYCLVIEKHEIKPEKLKAPKHGTIWQPFFD